MPRAITVMHLRASNFVGGPEKQILEHLGSLHDGPFRGVLGTFVESGEIDPLGDEALRRGIETVRLPPLSPLDPRSVLRIAGVLKERGVAILCTHGYKPDLLGLLAAKRCGIPTIAVSRGWTWESRKIRLYEALDRRFLRHVDHVVAVSAGQRQKVVACGVPEERVSVIHNSIDLGRCSAPTPAGIREELGLPQDALLVASAGRLSPEKNQAAMIDAAREVTAGNPSVRFVVFGEGVLRQELEGRVAAAGLTGRFLLPGFRKDLQRVLHEIDIFMLPSFTEGLPNVVLEAFAAGKPVVASRVGGTPELVEEGISGFLTEPDDVPLMARHLARLAGDPPLRKRMGCAGREYVRRNFTFEKQNELYRRLYLKVAQ